jgi:nickel-dependent lactate racemase
MNHKFPYKEFVPLEIPDSNLLAVYTLQEQEQQASDKDLVSAALEHPIGCPKLRDQVKPGMRVSVAVDDYSRSTKTELMLPLVIEELQKGGVDPDGITIVIAIGTHRSMSQAEIKAKYSPAIASRYRIVNPDWKDRSSYVDVGQNSNNLTLRIHRDVVEADFVVGVGQTIPHMIAGFGGGGKIINPGCSDGDTIGDMHWLCHRVPEDRLFAVRDNAVRELIDDVALKVGLRFIVNEVPGGGGRMAGAFAGHPIEAHRQACRAAREACTVTIKEKADIVLADAYPADLDFWQALKGLNAAYGAVRDGGTVILVTPCPEGTSAQHPELTEVGYIATDRTIKMVEQGVLDKAVAANLFLGRRLLDKAQAVLVTKGISEADTRAMGFLWSPDPASALELALEKHGNNARINVLYKAAKMVCEAELSG